MDTEKPIGSKGRKQIMDGMSQMYRVEFKKRPSYDGRKNLFSPLDVGPHKEVHNLLYTLTHLNIFSSTKLCYEARSTQ
jgi:hypothetical protein